MWDLETNECMRILEDHDDTVCALSVAAGYLFSGSYTHIKVCILRLSLCVVLSTFFVVGLGFRDLPVC